jgi:hypothetical protein
MTYEHDRHDGMMAGEKISEKNLSHCHFIHHKHHMD